MMNFDEQLTVELNGRFCRTHRIGGDAAVPVDIVALKVVDGQRRLRLVAGARLRHRVLFAAKRHKFKLKFLEIFFFFKFDSLVEDHVVATVTILDPVIDAGRMRFDFADQLDFRAEWGAHQLRFGKHRRLNCTSMLGFNRMFNTQFDSP